ncbi:uncharacterized protein RCC_01938 [Ramularia collo-cygni]|uniref:BTB domain-containing protein n=1 Tax=Ramularia collo-cygni TaxID=112498 RepID=A0A2D3UVH0_9PEZI|nr:uncharacterized protein RCC_01938 [Ramularia collo-cygni]CZT16097.1 uncharacterized protein RCC_01938 [Ramularia collo-cygni]
MSENASKRMRADSGQAPITPISPIFSKSPQMPSQVITICPEGDAIIVASGVGGRAVSIGLRASTELLSISSPVFKRLLAEQQPFQEQGALSRPTRLITLTADPGTALFTLLNVLHLRNEVLPARVDPKELSQFVEIAAKYSCLPAASRAASPWLDHIYHRYPDPPLYQMAKAALVLGDAIYFARFSSRWVLEADFSQQSTPTIPMNHPHHRLSKALLQRQMDGIQALRIDFDDIHSPLADALSSQYKHYVDTPPGDDGTSIAMGGDPDAEYCVSDKEGALEYLAALRDAKLWPESLWPRTNLAAITDLVAKLRIPEYDASDACHFCAHVDEEFANAMDDVRLDHKDRLWGLCLECYKAGGIRAEECTYQHEKPSSQVWLVKLKGNVSGQHP